MAKFSLTPVAQQQVGGFRLSPVQEDEPRIGNFRLTPVEEPEKEGTLQEIGEGIASGLLAIPQGIGELGAAGVDLVTGASTSKAVTNFFEGVRDYAGIDPEGTAGELAEVISQYAVPGLGAASVVSKVSKAPKLIKGLQQIGAAGATDAVVTTSGNTSIGDFFGGGPTQTTDLIGLEGRERALALMGNKLKIGLEAAGATAALEPTFKALGITGQAALRTAAKGPVAREAARAALSAGTAISSGAGKLTRNLLGDDNTEVVASVFRARGALPQDVFETRSRITGTVEAEALEAARGLRELKQNLDSSYKKVETIMAGDGNTKLTRAETNNELYSYLTGETTLETLPVAIQSAAAKMRKQVDDLSEKVLDSNFLNQADSEELVEQIKGNIGSYLRRKYKLFEDGAWKNTDEFAEAKEGVIQLFQNSPKTYETFYERVYTKDLPITAPDDHFMGVGSSRKTIRENAETLVEDFIEIAGNRKKYKNPMKGATRTAVNKIKTDMFKARTVQNPAIRRMLGEIKDPEEAFISTVADLAEFSAVDDFLGYMAGRAGGTGEILTKEVYDRLPPAIANRYTLLNEDYWGSAKNIAVSNPIYKDLTRQVQGDDEAMMNIIRGGYSGLLKAKGFSQYTKTVLSPITQVRNVTSAGLFALAQGNVGSGANLFESLGTVWDSILKRPDKDKFYGKMQRLGVVGTQAQLREVDRLMKEGLGTTREADEVVGGVRVGGTAGMKFAQGKIGNFIGVGAKANNLARSFYQGGDDVWKIYNFEFERSKILSAFDGDEAAARAAVGDLDEYAANIIKNVVPNYERVPQIVAAGRKLPVGNFVAFPAEILRTSFNTMDLALKEIANPNAKIREIGLRRMTGLVGTTVVAPVALQQLAMNLTGVSQEQLDAARRSGPPWSKNNRLIPISTDDEGNLTGYVDYSYTNPYDFLQKPFQAIYNSVLDGKQLGQDTGQIMANASADVLKEFFSPFLDESIITERLADTTIRGGQTRTGARVFRDVDTLGTKMYKSMFHIAESFNPGISPVTLKAQKKETQMPDVEVGRFIRGTFNMGKDPAGNERQAAGEFVRAFSGIGEVEVKPDNIVMYSSFDYRDNVTGARQIFNTAVKTRGNLDQEDAVETYRSANEALLRTQNKMYQVVQDMRALGQSDTDIRRALKKYNIADVGKLMRGEFVPLKISRNTRKAVRENGNTLPLAELREIERDFRNRRLGAIIESERGASKFTLSEPVTSAGSNRQTVPLTGQVATNPSLAGVGPVRVAPTGSTPVLQPQARAALLGSDPISVARNAQILQRNQ